MLMKQGKKDQTAPLLEQKAQAQNEKADLDEIANNMEKDLNKKLASLGNLVHESCIDSKDEKDNEIVKMWWPEGRSEDVERKKRTDKIGTLLALFLEIFIKNTRKGR